MSIVDEILLEVFKELLKEGKAEVYIDGDVSLVKIKGT